MAHTEKCRGCMYENKCDYISCRKEHDKEHDKKIKAKAIDDFVNKLLNWKPQDEEYKSLSEVCYEIAEQMKGVRNE